MLQQLLRGKQGLVNETLLAITVCSWVCLLFVLVDLI